MQVQGCAHLNACCILVPVRGFLLRLSQCSARLTSFKQECAPQSIHLLLRKQSDRFGVHFFFIAVKLRMKMCTSALIFHCIDFSIGSGAAVFSLHPTLWSQLESFIGTMIQVLHEDLCIPLAKRSQLSCFSFHLESKDVVMNDKIIGLQALVLGGGGRHN